MTGNSVKWIYTGWKLLTMAERGWKCMEMHENGLKCIEMAGSC